MGGHVETTITPMGTVVAKPARLHKFIGLALGTIAWTWIFYRLKEEGRIRFGGYAPFKDYHPHHDDGQAGGHGKH